MTKNTQYTRDKRRAYVGTLVFTNKEQLQTRQSAPSIPTTTRKWQPDTLVRTHITAQPPPAALPVTTPHARTRARHVTT